jgi:hypothetical protein
VGELAREADARIGFTWITESSAFSKKVSGGGRCSFSVQ